MGHVGRRRLWGLALLGGGLLAAALLSLWAGSVPVPVSAVVRTLLSPGAPAAGAAAADLDAETIHTIVWQIRLPRILLAVLAGSGLATAGAAFQGMLRNPLADPYVLGVSAGASAGAAGALLAERVWGLALGVGAPVFAFVGALLAVAAVYFLAHGRGRVATTGLVLAGTAVGAFFFAVISYVQTTGDEKVQKAVVYWMAGGFSTATWEQVRLAAPYVLIGLAVLVAFGRDLNAMLLGEEAAVQLGVPVENTKIWVMAAASLATAAATAVSGLIPFVGLMVPHMIRLVLGADHRVILPASALGGGLFLLLADTAGRTLWAPLEVRVSIITGLAGGPFFLWLLRRYLKGGGG